MSTRLKWAYRALILWDAAEAAYSKTPRWILEMGILMMGWILIGGSPMACLWVFAAAGIALAAIVLAIITAMVTIRLLGFAEEDLERWALA